jgi:hypothetical protein
MSISHSSLRASLFGPSFVVCLIFAVPSLAEDFPWGYTHGGQNYNATYDAKRIICVYPLSGQYSLLNRLLYYALIIVAVFGHSHLWLVTGPLAYVMTYSSTAAVHAVIMAGVSKNGLFDIDALGAWAVISVGCLAVLPMFIKSEIIRESEYSPVFGFWGTLVAVGAICSIVSTHRQYPDELECRSSTSLQLLTSQAQLFDQSFNCSYTCFAYSQPLRPTSEIIAIPKIVAFGHFRILEWATGLTASLGILSALFACFPMHRKSTEAELHEIIKSNRPRKGQTAKSARIKANARRRARKELETGKYTSSGMSIFGATLSCLLMIVVGILNEVFILAYNGGFHTNEHPYAIGQWGPWVAVLLAVIAASIVKLHKPRWEARQKLLAEESDAYQKRKVDSESSGKPFSHSVDVEAGLAILDDPVVGVAAERGRGVSDGDSQETTGNRPSRHVDQHGQSDVGSMELSPLGYSGRTGSASNGDSQEEPESELSRHAHQHGQSCVLRGKNSVEIPKL